MIDDIHHHTLHYLILALVLASGLYFFSLFRYQPLVQWWIGIVMAVSYVSWGIGHHMIVEKHMQLKIVIEYILISFIGLLLLWGILGL